MYHCHFRVVHFMRSFWNVFIHCTSHTFCLFVDNNAVLVQWRYLTFLKECVYLIAFCICNLHFYLFKHFYSLNIPAFCSFHVVIPLVLNHLTYMGTCKKMVTSTHLLYYTAVNTLTLKQKSFWANVVLQCMGFIVDRFFFFCLAVF